MSKNINCGHQESTLGVNVVKITKADGTINVDSNK